MAEQLKLPPVIPQTHTDTGSSGSSSGCSVANHLPADAGKVAEDSLSFRVRAMVWEAM